MTDRMALLLESLNGLHMELSDQVTPSHLITRK